LDGMADERTLQGGLREALVASWDEVGWNRSADRLVLEKYTLARGYHLCSAVHTPATR